ncbi:MAG: PIN domain-containing protein [Caulobacteraceae bacterium]
MIEVVADASALLAYFAHEPGRDELLRVQMLRICAVSQAEVVGRLLDWGLDDVSVAASFRSLSYSVASFDGYRAEITGRLRRDPVARRLSLGDRACLSLALQTGLPVLTADRAWAELEIGVDVRLIR